MSSDEEDEVVLPQGKNLHLKLKPPHQQSSSYHHDYIDPEGKKRESRAQVDSDSDNGERR